LKFEYASQRKAYSQALLEIGGRREDLVVLDADLSSSTQTAKFGERFPHRFFNCGIAEQNMMGTAAGFAASGKTVLVSTFAIFATGRCWDQIRQSIAYPKFNVKIVASHAGITVGGMNAEEAIAEKESFSQEGAAVTQHIPSKRATPPKSLETEPVESVVSTTQTSLLLYFASFCLGAVLYLAALGGHFLLSLDVAASWAIVVVGSILILLGLRRFYDVVLPISDARRGNIGT
jgi:hypothetical protein